jgi:polysaccharide biosynthesis/export protein
MPLSHLFCSSAHRLASGSGALLLLMLQASSLVAPALAQMPTLEPADPSISPSTSTSQESLEQARQRLIERGSLLQPSTEPESVFLNESEQEFESYRLGPGDSIFVNVQQFPDLNIQATLDLQGNVILPLVGILSLEGFTLPMAQTQIQTLYNQYVVDPDISLTLVAQRPVEVSVLGEVVRPGSYPLASPQLSVALLAAGGTTRLSDLRSLRIRRVLPDGGVVERNVDLFTPLENSTALPNVRLEDGDAIIIPTLTVAASEDYDRTLVARSTLGPPQIEIRVLSYASGGNRSDGAALSRIALPGGSNFVDALTAIAPNPDTADLNSVAVVRFDPEQGRAVSQELNARDALQGDMSQNPTLEDNDVIIVGRNSVTQLTATLNTFTQPFRDVLGFLLFFESLANSATNLFSP